jgi:hypothetical protein
MPAYVSVFVSVCLLRGTVNGLQELGCLQCDVRLYLNKTVWFCQCITLRFPGHDVVFVVPIRYSAGTRYVQLCLWKWIHNRSVKFDIISLMELMISLILKLS